METNWVLGNLVCAVILLVGRVLVSNSLKFDTFGNETDWVALIDFKNQITLDLLRIMTTWNDSVHFCRWTGVTCSPSNKRVVVLDLESRQLAGSLPPSIGNLTSLTGLNLMNNSFRGEIPQEIGRLISLRHLNLSYNSFLGRIPPNLTHCVHLRVLNCSGNQLVGQIPDQLRTLSNLQHLDLGKNKLVGTIPSWIGNFSSLFSVVLWINGLRGDIPNEFGQLSSLKFLRLSLNQLTGTIPSSIYNISSIYFFSVTQNRLHGEIPGNIGLTLSNLEVFLIGGNNFTGKIPLSLANTSRLQKIDFASNNMTGTVPVNLGKLQSLSYINFENNWLGNGKINEFNFLSSLANCSILKILALDNNVFGGELPRFIGNLSTDLQHLFLGFNWITGKVPDEIGNLVNLTALGLEVNSFSGSIPESFGNLKLLEGLYLHGNNFSGQIPPSLGNLTTLTELYLENNRLEGSIPPSLGNCRSLLVLNLSSNNLNGSIPREVLGLSSLSISLAMADNALSGPIPIEISSLKNLKELNISKNKLSGEIPSSLGSCVSMEQLILDRNTLRGSIPESLNTLRGLKEMDLSYNNLSGQIPNFLAKLQVLVKLGLSHNNFQGEVPYEGIFMNASAISILGNQNLCGGVADLHLPTCPQNLNIHSSRNFWTPKIVVPLAVGIVLSIWLCIVAPCFLMKRRKNAQSTNVDNHQSGVSYVELAKATNGFSDENIIGSGSFGTVYKGTLHQNKQLVAVKVLNLQQCGANESFEDECRVLKSIRHRNLLKIVTACLSHDHRGDDFKALVFEFMANGNLDRWLHHGDRAPQASLDLTQRLKIAIDVASALEYLHHHCHMPIVHCDIKPSNILLDNDMTAHVGDFGLASFVCKSSNDVLDSQSLTTRLKGSIGYIAPEINMGGQVTTLADVYSFGILLLEMFTGKRPTDEAFTDRLNIRGFVARAFPQHVKEIVDPCLLVEDDEKINDNSSTKMKTQEKPNIKTMESLVSMLRIGLSCSSPLPRERSPMSVVVNEMHAIKDSFPRFRERNRRTR